MAVLLFDYVVVSADLNRHHTANSELLSVAEVAANSISAEVSASAEVSFSSAVGAVVSGRTAPSENTRPTLLELLEQEQLPATTTPELERHGVPPPSATLLEVAQKTPPETPATSSDGSPAEVFYLRLFFVRHGYSCANVPWNACSVDQAKLTKDGMDANGAKLSPSTNYNDELESINKVVKRSELTKGEGHLELDKDFGVVPRGWTGGEGHKLITTKTKDGSSDDCLVKVKAVEYPAGEAPVLKDNLEYGADSALVALRQLVQDPHITDCDLWRAQRGADKFASYVKKHKVVFDMVASSSLRRAMETAQIMFRRNPGSLGEAESNGVGNESEVRLEDILYLEC